VIAALELALYDIKGKWLGVPVYELIGGLYRDKIPLYWSHFASYRVLDGPAMGTPPVTTIADWVGLVDDVEKAGFKALKTNLLIPGLASGLPPTLDGAIDKWRVNAAVEFIGALRDRCGPDMGILFDVGQEYRMGGIVQLGRALEPFNLYWLEAEGFDPDALLAARRQTRTRICHGEALIGRQAFRPFFEKHVTDVVMIETLNNGLTETRKIADLAAHYDTMFSPHNYMSPLSNLINTHLCAAMPNVEILEIDMDDVPWKWDLIDQKLDIANGEITVPKRPGWGANIVESELAKHPVKGHARPEFLSAMATADA
jgi:L-alanine-DL-glutamate epimerase-like enolase superfamily enzyme